MNPSPFSGDTPELRALDRAQRAGVISRGTWLDAVRVERTRAHWHAWARFWLRVYGAALVLAGVVFFFAWNWAAMHRFEKFVLIEIALAGCALLAWRSGFRTARGQAWLAGAAVLTGVLMAVFGQTYQTGADAWQLFRGWALLILPWVLVADAAALWVLWLVIADVAILLYADQTLAPQQQPHAMVVAGFLPFALLALRDTIGDGRWLAARWLRPLLLVGAFGLLTLPVFAAMFDNDGAPLLWLVAWFAALALAYVFYRFRRPDLIALTLLVFDAALVLLVWIAKLLFDSDIGTASLQVYALVILAVVGGAYQWLRFEAAALHRVAAEVQHA